MGGGAACRELARNGGSRLSETHRRSDGGAGPLREDLASVTRRPSPVADCSSVTRAVTLGGPPLPQKWFHGFTCLSLQNLADGVRKRRQVISSPIPRWEEVLTLKSQKGLRG